MRRGDHSYAYRQARSAPDTHLLRGHVSDDDNSASNDHDDYSTDDRASDDGATHNPDAIRGRTTRRPASCLLARRYTGRSLLHAVRRTELRGTLQQHGRLAFSFQREVLGARMRASGTAPGTSYRSSSAIPSFRRRGDNGGRSRTVSDVTREPCRASWSTSGSRPMINTISEEDAPTGILREREGEGGSPSSARTGGSPAFPHLQSGPTTTRRS
jgi:hypothetical protein